jgi:FixJ family two-component response regulator
MRKTIFVVDDDPSMRLGVKRLLKQYGFETEVFDSVEDFHERADVGRPDCLVLDIKLRNRSGIELSRELASAGVSVPVIFITANDNDLTRKAAEDAGCVAYLTKPFLGKTLIDAIDKAATSN